MRGFDWSTVHGLAGDDHRAVAVAHAAAARQQRVLVEQMRIGMDADGGDFQLAAQGPAIERLDVLQFVLEEQVAGVDLVVGQSMKHEGIIGIGAVADGDESLRHGPIGWGIVIGPPNAAARAARNRRQEDNRLAGRRLTEGVLHVGVEAGR